MNKFPASLAALLIVGSIGAVPIVGWGAVFARWLPWASL